MAKRKRISFDPEDRSLIEIIKDISEEYRIPPGDLLNWLTLKGLLRFIKGEDDFSDDITDSKLLRYEKRLDLSDLIDEIKRRLGK